MNNILNKLNLALQRLELIIFGRGFPPEALCIAGQTNMPNLPSSRAPKQFSLKELIGDGILWAVPKKRRTVEKRLNRKFGWPEYVWKPLVAKTNILMCPNCGYDYEAGLLCGHCYAKVKEETKEMQNLIQEKLGLDPVEKDVIVIYEGENVDKTSDFWKDQKVVEMPKKRPNWFHQNLLQPTTQEPSESKEVKPTDLA